MYVYSWIPLLCTWNTVSQLYVNDKYTLRKKCILKIVIIGTNIKHTQLIPVNIYYFNGS